MLTITQNMTSWQPLDQDSALIFLLYLHAELFQTKLICIISLKSLSVVGIIDAQMVTVSAFEVEKSIIDTEMITVSAFVI